MAEMSAGYRSLVDIKPPGDLRRAFSAGELAVTLFGLAVLAFGIGAGIEIAGLGRGLAVVAAAALVLVFVLVLLRGVDPRPGRRPARPGTPSSSDPGSGPDVVLPAEVALRAEPALLEDRAVLEDPALRAERALFADRAAFEQAVLRDHSLAAERPRTGYFLGVAGGAALALTLGGVLFLALPSDYTALTVLLAGVLGWTAVVLLSVRLQSRR
jgi:hypothetical protein